MQPTDVTTVLFDFFPYGFIKLMVLAIMIMYLVFAGIIVRQEELMSKVVAMSFSPLLRLVAFAHLIAAVVAFLLAIIFL